MASSALQIVSLSLLLAASSAGCGGDAKPPAGSAVSAEDTELASVDARLRGSWRLAEYRPEVPLEATFQALLTMQVQTMVIRFEGGRLLADSPTIHINRAYKVTNAAGPIFKIVSTDEMGSAIVSACQFNLDGNEILFRGQTEPWIGTGSIRRQP